MADYIGNEMNFRKGMHIPIYFQLTAVNLRLSRLEILFMVIYTFNLAVSNF